jgi:hypothetical protein
MESSESLSLAMICFIMAKMPKFQQRVQQEGAGRQGGRTNAPLAAPEWLLRARGP